MWHRVGHFLWHIAVVVLHLPMLRYVDDYFGVDHLEVVEHAVNCFARVVRAILGPSAVSARKTGFGTFHAPTKCVCVLICHFGEALTL